jgi:hypothetical protein
MKEKLAEMGKEMGNKMSDVAQDLGGAAAKGDFSQVRSFANEIGTIARNYGQEALGVLNESLGFMKGHGVNKLHSPKMVESQRSFSDVFVNGKKIDDDDDLPTGPGNAYVTHLFKRQQVGEKLKAKAKEAVTGGANVFTEQMEALKLAVKTMGIASERNPGGMPIDIKEAKKIWFGKDGEIDPIAESEWRNSVELGDNKLDPKRVRKFVNHDGSLTWEILNEDKTVMSRFTMGDYAGTKIFAQGGYNKFAEVLKKARQQLGQDTGGEFDAIRSMFGG